MFSVIWSSLSILAESNPSLVSAVSFAVLFGASLFGMVLHRWLTEHHRSPETKDSVRIGMASVATMAALVLGLLVASTQGAYDSEKDKVIELSAKIIYLDQLFVSYGPEASECRTVLRGAVKSAISLIWPDEKLGVDLPDPGSTWGQALPIAIQKLAPQNDLQKTFKFQATEIAKELGQMRWLLFEETEDSVPMSLIAIMVFWLALTFTSIGLFAPFNRIVVIAQLLSSFAVAGAIFLIMELDHPFAGMIKISSKPMVSALEHLGK